MNTITWSSTYPHPREPGVWVWLICYEDAAGYSDMRGGSATTIERADALRSEAERKIERNA